MPMKHVSPKSQADLLTYYGRVGKVIYTEPRRSQVNVSGCVSGVVRLEGASDGRRKEKHSASEDER